MALWICPVILVKKMFSKIMVIYYQREAQTIPLDQFFSKTYTTKSSANLVMPKVLITLTPPPVGRHSADLSADKVPDFSSFFIGRQKKYNYLVMIFFHRPTVLGFLQSADDRPIVGR